MKKLLLASTIATLFSINVASADDELMVYHVTVTNLTTHHILTPPIIVAHKKNFSLFKLGDKMHPASDGLATLAKSGNSAPLAAELSDNRRVSAVYSETGPVFAGEPSMAYEIIAPKGTVFSVATMLATSNDAFSAVRIKAPKKGRTARAMGKTYDAGAEMNNENCDYMPGPPCNSMNKDASGEGFVSVHTGVYGKSGITASMFDWRGPTSMVTIHNAGKYEN